jgi:hypothetical protein
MPASFGQVCWGKAKSSPNASLIRTGLLWKSQKQSECQPHSDRFVGEELKAVRMRASFGQVRCGRAQSSPNASFIRTGSLGKSQKQSECEPHSDRYVGEEPKAVSPNASFIRTGFIGTSQKQSECKLHADRFVGEEPKAVQIPVSFGQVCCGRAKAVRMRASFGQVCCGRAESSPNASLIRTGTAENSNLVIY